MADKKIAGQVFKMGVELEGGWNTKPSGVSLNSDGSVHVGDVRYNFEIPSPPLPLDELLKWTDKYYPDKTNASCGLHIHASFTTNLAYMQLMSRGFHRYFLQQVTKWGKAHKIKQGSQFWQRLEGKNSFCLKRFTPERQVKMRSKDGCRYTQLNYCYGLYRTIECRLFPAFQKKSLALSAIQEYHDICNSFLLKYRREKVFRNTVNTDYDAVSKDVEIVRL